MDILVWLVFGGLIGWAASFVMGTKGRQGIMVNVLVGVVGAALGNWIYSGALRAVSIHQVGLTIPAIVVSVVGAICLLAAAKLLHRIAVHKLDD